MTLLLPPVCRRVWPSLLCVLCLSAMATRPCHGQADIFPGLRVDTIRLGMSAAQVRASGINPPDAVIHAPGGLTEMNWDEGPYVLLRGGRVLQVEVDNEAETTPDGVHTGDTLARVRARYHPLRRTVYMERDASGRAQAVDIYDDLERGIAFEFEPNNGVGSRVDLESIIVHVPGRPVLPSPDLRP